MEAIIFDFDGTIIDSESDISKIIVDTFREISINLDENDLNYIIGIKWINIFDYLFDKYNIKNVIQQIRLENNIMAKYYESLENIKIIPGVIDTIKELFTSYKIGLVSGSNIKDILFVLDKLDILKYFNVVLGAEDYLLSKPNPSGYLKAMDILQVDPSKCVIFEDSLAGVESGVSSGAKVIQVIHTFKKSNNINKYISDKTKYRIDDFLNINSKFITELLFN